MYSKKVFLTIIILVIGLQTSLVAASTPVRQCADGASTLPLMVQIDDCEELPCNLLKGSESNIAIQFIATRNSMHKLLARVHLTTLGVTLPYELEESRSNVCDNLLNGAYCPLDAGEDATYRLMLPIAEHQLEVPTRIEVTLHDSLDDTVVSCFLADARIKKP